MDGVSHKRREQETDKYNEEISFTDLFKPRNSEFGNQDGKHQ
jgi:hypothetical protein